MAELTELTIAPVGVVRGGRKEDSKDFWGDNLSVIELDARLPEGMLAGIEQHSHLEVIFYFHLHDDEPTSMQSRHPRNNPEWPKVGIFSQRARMRPNRLGHTICRLLKRDGRQLHVQALDAIDGTPVIDLKPVWQENLPSQPVIQPDWSHELMAQYWASKKPT
ncbi:SAM-dependent methyltransferase [Reinekea blandensis]|uniref:TsaA-like domain-containing protein n=1 Tax=Reinekea blandensis MED297 TaxID=314283 RepID=A4BGY8_9GAMM|nr:SAM-dependent methyltransferase [Reinekea blandensis]EAR08634.1 hypothetical protein MED297_02980 [Reinekea sp. MED297] [Reinekea blandensis MED297]